MLMLKPMANLVPLFVSLQQQLLESEVIAESMLLLNSNGQESNHLARVTEIKEKVNKLLCGLLNNPPGIVLFSELDILRGQYLALSKELYQKRQENAPAYELEAISNIQKGLIEKIKTFENIDPASLILD